MTAQLPAAPKVFKSDYEGFSPTIAKVAAYIRECGDDPSFQRFAAGVLDRCFPRDKHTTVLERAQCLLTYQNKHGPRFAPDPPNSERVTSPKLTLCIDGAGAMCIPMEDCESQLAAYLSLCRASGIDCWIVIQKLQHPGGRIEWHMIGMIQLDDGSKVRVDPSLKGNSRVGQYQPALEEQIIDPLDPAVTGASGGAKLVTIGATPRIFWETTMMRPMFGHGSATLGPKGRNMTGKPCCKKCAESGGNCAGKKKLAARPLFAAAGMMTVQRLEAAEQIPEEEWGMSWWEDMS